MRPSPAWSPTARCSSPPRVAALVGLISFASPCVLPLVPGYLSYVTGLVGTGAPHGGAGTRGPAAGRRPRCAPTALPPGAHGARGAAVRPRLHASVFVAFGTAFGGLGRLLLEYADVVDLVFGVVTSSSGWRSSAGCRCCSAPSGSPSARPPGWPGRRCSASSSAWAGRRASAPPWRRSTRWPLTEATAGRGARARLAYCLGLGIPFVLVALGARWAVGATAFLRRHARTVTRVGGAVLVLVGLLLVTGAWTEMMALAAVAGWRRPASRRSVAVTDRLRPPRRRPRRHPPARPSAGPPRRRAGCCAGGGG